MSKSLGNFFTIAQLLETTDFGGRKWPGEVLRLAMLMTHYREPIDFTVRRLEEARRLLEKWERVAGEADLEAIWKGPSERLLGALLDDLNTSSIPRLLNDIQESEGAESLLANLAFLGLASTSVQRYHDTGEHPAIPLVHNLTEAVKYAAPHAKGRDLLAAEARGVIFDRLNFEIERRLAAFAAKDFATADRIRAELAEQGVALMDSKDPETGERRTKWEMKR